MAGILYAVLSSLRGRTIVLLLAGLLTGCAGGADAPRPMHVATRVEGETLRLEISDIPPAREITAAVLVDPAGDETPARERELITREEGSGGNAGPGLGVGASGGSSSGIRPHISLGYLFRGGETTRRSQRMTAEIPLTDPAAYAEGYRDWRVVLRYRDQLGEPQQVSVPAPAP
jgi:hypothetical protein